MIEHNIIRFTVELPYNIEAASVIPIFDDTGVKLLGGLVLRHGQTVSCFVAANEPPYNLFFSGQIPFYLTPQLDSNGIVMSVVLSECPMNSLSICYDWSLYAKEKKYTS